MRSCHSDSSRVSRKKRPSGNSGLMSPERPERQKLVPSTRVTGPLPASGAAGSVVDVHALAIEPMIVRADTYLTTTGGAVVRFVMEAPPACR